MRLIIRAYVQVIGGNEASWGLGILLSLCGVSVVSMTVELSCVIEQNCLSLKLFA